jgi:hypothetical protein
MAVPEQFDTSGEKVGWGLPKTMREFPKLRQSFLAKLHEFAGRAANAG